MSDELSLQYAITFLEFFVMMMKMENKPELEMPIKATNIVVKYAKDQYLKEELAGIMNGVGGGEQDGTGKIN